MTGYAPRVAAFCCEKSACVSADQATAAGGKYPEGVVLFAVPCTGRVDSLHILKAFEEGFDGVLVLGCFEDSCSFVTGNLRARRRVEYTRKLMAEIGLEPERLEMKHLSPASPERFLSLVGAMVEKIRELGPMLRAGAQRGVS